MTYFANEPTIVCLAHLGWDFVWQRPQQLLSRLAQQYPTIYIREPHIDTTTNHTPYLRRIPSDGGVVAYEPRLPNRLDVHENAQAHYINLVKTALAEHGIVHPSNGQRLSQAPLIVWFYTPMPVYVLDHIPADLVIFDAMDQLANFRFAPPDLIAREAELMQRADLVFTGGRSLYEARRDHHPNVYLFASGVDPSHFAQARQLDTEVASEIADLPGPVLGYYGVIDERIDLDMLSALATQRPDWSFVMVGPLAKIDPESLPRRPNIYYPGQQPYNRLPQFLKRFDVCLMPFALNEATQYISPTKALEYMAAHKPIVSTHVPDVVANWSHVVYLAQDGAGFIQAVEQALGETPTQRQARIIRQNAVITRHTWDRIAHDMGRLIDTALTARSEGR